MSQTCWYRSLSATSKCRNLFCDVFCARVIGCQSTYHEATGKERLGKKRGGKTKGERREHTKIYHRWHLGALVNPMVYQGDAVIHVATVEPLDP